MLVELRVENLLLIERAELRLGPGLTVITGETGAGKTMLAHALDLLLGGRPRAGIVRPGAREAYVEGIFEAPAGLLDEPALADMRERVTPEDGDPAAPAEIVLGRRVGAEGRTRAFVQGRSASAADLRELGTRLIAFFGQHEHRRLTLASAQLDLLDGFCGAQQLSARAQLRACHTRTRALSSTLEALRASAGTRERDLDLLAFEIEEIECVGPSIGEQRELQAERERLRRADALRAAAGAGGEAIAPESGEGGAALALAQAEGAAAGAGGIDPALDALTERLRAASLELEDLGAELRRYATGLDAEPGRLEEVEERLELYGRLERKHGGSVEAVLIHAESCRAERDRLERAEVEIEGAQEQLDQAEQELHRRAAALGAARREAAPRLAAAVRRELSDLAMEGAAFSVELRPRAAEDPDRHAVEAAGPLAQIGPTGAEACELMIAPNQGVVAAPLREIASGGELSRVMLALMTVVTARGARTLAFDEVDAGVGGQTARAVGERLRALAEGGQVICITHLPQVASLAEHHFRIEKLRGTPSAGSPGRAEIAVAVVEQLEGPGVVAELCRMLGADSADAGARRHAQELLAAA